MNELMNAAAGQPYLGTAKACVGDTTLTRAFDGMRNDIKIATEAASATLGSLKQLGERLGIASMYGCAKVGEVPAPASGEIESTQREMNALIELSREIRGLAETIDARL